MVSIFRTINNSTENSTRTKYLLRLGALFLVGTIFSLCLILKLATFPNLLVSEDTYKVPGITQEVHSWVLNYQDLTQASTRHQAFRELFDILQAHDNATQSIEKIVLSQQNDNTELLAIAVGVLSSQGTPEVQQALCNILQAFRNNDEKAIVVMPQIMLLEQPQDFLFDELQAFVHNSSNPLLQENAELVLAGLWQRASQMNHNLAHKITLWLEQKKAQLSEYPESLAHYLDLLGNTANEAFLDDILPLLTHENAEVRVRAVFALRLFRDEQAVIALKHQLSVDKNPQVNRKAAEALSYFYPTYSDSNNSTP
jgi:hypothetical protein